MKEVVFHIIGESDWAAVSGDGTYAPASLASEGFIHLSRVDQILRPANLLYSGRSDLLLLEIDVACLRAELVFEPGSHGEDEYFPHLYGALNTDAVIRVVSFPCGEDGVFELPVGLAP